MTTPPDAGSGHEPWPQPGQQPAWGQGPPGPGGARPPGYGAPPNGLAIGALIASIIGLLTTWLCGIGVIGAIIGVVLGYVARGQIRQSGGQQGGDGLALGAIIVGWIGIGVTVAGIMLFMLGMFGALIPGGW